MRFSSIESHVNTLYDELKVDNEIENIFKVCNHVYYTNMVLIYFVNYS
jgi:hypothetical protein